MILRLAKGKGKILSFFKGFSMKGWLHSLAKSFYFFKAAEHLPERQKKLQSLSDIPLNLEGTVYKGRTYELYKTYPGGAGQPLVYIGHLHGCPSFVSQRFYNSHMAESP